MLALLAVLFAPPAVVQVWSIEDGRTVQVAPVEGVDGAWIADDGVLTVSGRTPPAGIRHVPAGRFRGQTADGRFIVDDGMIRRSTTGDVVVKGPPGFPAGAGWVTAERPLGVAGWTIAEREIRRRRLGRGGMRRMVFAPTADGLRLVVGVVERPALHVFAGPDWARERRVDLPEAAGELRDLAVAGSVVFALCGRTLFRLDPRDGRLDPVPGGDVDAFAVSRDGAHLVIARGGALWQSAAEHPTAISRLKAEWAEDEAIAISPDGRRLALSRRPGAVRVLSTASGQEIWRRQGPEDSGASGIHIVYGPDLVDFAPDGTLYVDADSGDSIAVDFAVDPPAERRVNGAVEVWPTGSIDGSTIAVEVSNGVCIVTDGACHTMATFMTEPQTVALAPGGQLLAAAHADGPVTIIRLDGQPIGGEDDPPEGVVAEAYHRPGPLVALGWRLHGWNPEAAEARRSGPWLVATADTDRSGIASNGSVDVAMPDVNRPFALAGSNVVWAGARTSNRGPVLRAFDLAEGRAVQLEAWHRHPIQQVVSSPRGRWFATADEIGRIAVWQGDTLRAIQRWETGRTVLSLTFDPLEQRLVAVLGDPRTPSIPIARAARTLTPLARATAGVRTFVSEAPISAIAPVARGLLAGVGERLVYLDRDGAISPMHAFEAPIELLATDGCRAFVVTEQGRSLQVVPLGALGAGSAPPPDDPEPDRPVGVLSAMSGQPGPFAEMGEARMQQLLLEKMAEEEDAREPPGTRPKSAVAHPDAAARPPARGADGVCAPGKATAWAAPGNGRLRDVEPSHPTGNLLHDDDTGRVWLGTGYGIVIWDADGRATRIPTIPLDAEPEPGRVVAIDFSPTGVWALVKGASAAWLVAVRPDGSTGPPNAIRGLEGEPRDIVAVSLGQMIVVTDTGLFLVRWKGQVQSSFAPDAIRLNEPGIMVAAVARPGASHIADGWTLDALRRARLRRGHLEVEGQTRFPEPHSNVQLSTLIRWRGGLAAAWYDDGTYGITLFDDAPR